MVGDYYYGTGRRKSAVARVFLKPGKGEFKVHDLENLGDREMVFMTVEFKDSANKPMPLPAGVRPQSEAA